MISCDTSKLQAELQKLQQEVTRKLEGMVEIFVYNITVEAIDNTPIGTFNPLYNLTSRMRVLPAAVGSAKGGWTISMNKATRIIFPERAENASAFNIKENADVASKSYKIGDTVFITNSVPYVATEGWSLPSFGSLEGGYSQQAPFGIMEPTLNAILGIYEADLKKYYEAS